MAVKVWTCFSLVVYSWILQCFPTTSRECESLSEWWDHSQNDELFSEWESFSEWWIILRVRIILRVMRSFSEWWDHSQSDGIILRVINHSQNEWYHSQNEAHSQKEWYHSQNKPHSCENETSFWYQMISPIASSKLVKYAIFITWNWQNSRLDNFETA